MIKNNKIWLILTALLIPMILFATGCSDDTGDVPKAAPDVDLAKTDEGQEPLEGGRETRAEILVPEASGDITYGSDGATIDASHTAEGYIMVGYEGDASKVKLQVTAPDQVQYTYTLAIGSMETFPLVAGDGSYQVDVLENAYDNMYALICSETIEVEIEDELKPFLYPNQYVWFEQADKPIQYARELSDQVPDDLKYVEAVYNYVIENIDYDTQKAETVTSGYLPDITETMETGKGICFDYASLTASMLRSQGVPTKLQIGYSGDAYHAWISVYIDEIGWVDDIIEFDGSNWSLIDPTLAAGNNASSVKKYIGDGSNYTLKYSY